MSKKLFTLLGLLLLTGLVAGCGATPAPTANPTAVPTPGGVDKADLKISGKVAKEMAWTEEKVRAMPTVQVQSTNKQGEAQTYTGVPINKLLEVVGLAAEATMIAFVAADGSTAEVALADIDACEDCIISFRSQGGFSTVLPGFPNDLQVKGVIEIQVK
jgi:DMSO/TMAO reductase YedYZ molybdopterin-dependent catalytic subunit